MNFDSSTSPDLLSEYLERVRAKGRIFYADTLHGTLDFQKPESMAFINFVESGDLDLVRTGSPTIRVREPCLLLSPSTCRYRLRSASPKGVRLICASFDFGRSIVDAFPLGAQDSMVFTRDSIPNATALTNMLLAEFQGSEPGRERGLSTLLEYTLVLLLRKAIKEGRMSRGILASMLDPRMAALLSLIHRTPERDWMLSDLASVAAMSRSALSVRFHATLGMAPIAYVSAWRLKVAQDFIREGMELKVVAAKLGYSSQAAFTRAFARDVGEPPSTWRRQQIAKTSLTPENPTASPSTSVLPTASTKPALAS